MTSALIDELIRMKLFVLEMRDLVATLVWDFAAELLLRAAETRKRRDVEAATSQMDRALHALRH
jgi:hypothetical protein